MSYFPYGRTDYSSPRDELAHAEASRYLIDRSRDDMGNLRWNNGGYHAEIAGLGFVPGGIYSVGGSTSPTPPPTTMPALIVSDTAAPATAGSGGSQYRTSPYEVATSPFQSILSTITLSPGTGGRQPATATRGAPLGLYVGLGAAALVGVALVAWPKGKRRRRR